MTVTRYVQKFTSADGSVEVTLPRRRYELELAQPLRTPRATAIGTDYAIRLIGDRPGLKANAHVRIRALLAGRPWELDYERDEMVALLHQIGLGKLWTSDGRWAWASLAEMPEVQINYLRPSVVPVFLDFELWSDFFGEEVIATTDVTGSGVGSTNLTVTNPGLYPATQMIVSLESTGSAGLTPFKLTCAETGAVWESGRGGSGSNTRVRLVTLYVPPSPGTGLSPAQEFSNNAGASWSDDFSNYVVDNLPSGQPLLSFRLAPGVNNLTFERTENVAANLVITFSPPYGVS